MNNQSGKENFKRNFMKRELMIFVKAYSKWHFKLLQEDFQKIFHEIIASNPYKRQKSLMRFLTGIYLIFYLTGF